MEVLSTSNLVSSETKKTTTACDFEYDYVMRGQIRSYVYFMIAETWKGTPWNTYTQNNNIKINQQ